MGRAQKKALRRGSLCCAFLGFSVTVKGPSDGVLTVPSTETVYNTKSHLPAVLLVTPLGLYPKYTKVPLGDLLKHTSYTEAQLLTPLQPAHSSPPPPHHSRLLPPANWRSNLLGKEEGESSCH